MEGLRGSARLLVNPPLPNKLDISRSLAITKALILEAVSLRRKRRVVPGTGDGLPEAQVNVAPLGLVLYEPIRPNDAFSLRRKRRIPRQSLELDPPGRKVRHHRTTKGIIRPNRLVEPCGPGDPTQDSV
jgi:hypothetical protein